MWLARRSIGKLMALAALMLATAPSFAQKDALSRSVSLQIVAVVPPILNLSLDFAPSHSASLNGYLSKGKVPAINASYQSGPQFELRGNESIDLGNATFFSNIPHGYTISAASLNSGYLKGNATLIPYFLKIGDSIASASGGVFSFSAFGKTNRGGRSLPVSILIGSVPQTAESGVYTDTLVFGISAN